MSEDIVRIEKLANGYEVEVCSPAVKKANAKRDSSKGMYVPYQDPWKGYAFKTAAEVAAFLSKVLDKLAPQSDDDEYSDAFDSATAEDD